MPPSIPTDDLAPVVQPLHYRWTEHFSACGLSLERVQWPIRLTTQVDDTTCERCIETLRAAGLAAGVARQLSQKE